MQTISTPGYLYTYVLLPKALQTFILHTKDLELYVISQRYVPYLFKLCQLVLFWVSIFFVKKVNFARYLKPLI